MGKWKCATLLIIREMQVKTTIRYHVISARMTIIQIPRKTNVNEDVEKREALWTLECKLMQPLWKKIWKISEKIKSRTLIWSNNPTSVYLSKWNNITFWKRFLHYSIISYKPRHLGNNLSVCQGMTM